MDWIENFVNDFFIGEGQKMGLAGNPGSRRVVLHHIPSTISLATVLEAVAAPDDPQAKIPGGIISAQIFNDPSREARTKTHQCALVEFMHPSTASLFVNHLQKHELSFNATNTQRKPRLHRVQAHLAHSQSNALRSDTIYQILSGQTRAIVVPTCPPEIVWEMLCTIGTRVLTKAEYARDKSSLLLEFVSMFEADKAYDLLCSDYHPRFTICRLVPPQFIRDSTQRGLGTINGQIIQACGRSLAAEFDQKPFNSSCGLDPASLSPFHRLSLVHLLCFRNHILPHELPNWLTERQNAESQDIKSKGNDLGRLSKPLDWAVDPDSRVKHLLVTSLHEPQLADAWDDYFRLRGLPNLRRYDAYGTCAAGGARGNVPEVDGRGGKSTYWNGKSHRQRTEHRLGAPQESLPSIFVDDGKPRAKGYRKPKDNDFEAADLRLADVPTQEQTMPWVLSEYDELCSAEETRLKTKAEAEMDPILIHGFEMLGQVSRDGAEYQDWLYDSPLESDAAAGQQGREDDAVEDLICF